MQISNPEVTHEASQGAMPAQNALQESETETRELLGIENRVSQRGSLISPPGKCMIFYLSGLLNIFLLATPLNLIQFHFLSYCKPRLFWISFLVNPEVIPGRMTLLVTIFLVLINIFNTIQTNSPKAEGLTAIEAWVIGETKNSTIALIMTKLPFSDQSHERNFAQMSPEVKNGVLFHGTSDCESAFLNRKAHGCLSH